MKYLNDIYNVDSYKAIKEIPDKSIDLIYTDIPYLIRTGGGGKSDLALRIQKEGHELGLENSKNSILKKIQECEEKMAQASTKEEYEKWRIIKNNHQNNLNLHSADIANGIDYSILDEFVRVMRYIYIYMVQ